MLFIPQNVIDVTRRSRNIINDDYAKAYSQAKAAGLMWSEDLFAELNSDGKAEILNWFLTTAQIEKGEVGFTKFQDLVAQSYVVENDVYGGAIRVTRDQFSDDDLKGVMKWASDMGILTAFFAQEQAAALLKNGKTLKGYDGVPFFSTNHPVNPMDATKGVFSNLLTGMALTPTNVANAYKSIANLKTPNGKNRMLVPMGILHPTALLKEAKEAVNARLVANAAGTAGVENVISDYGLKAQEARECNDEPGAWYIVCRSMTQLGGALIKQTREAFSSNKFDGTTQADLDRDDAIQIKYRGRFGFAYGNPFEIIRCEV